MSIQVVAWALDQPVTDAAAKLVLIVLANHADHKNGRCFPTVPAIAAEASQSIRTVQRKLRLLQDMGLITVEQCRAKDDRQMANSYRLAVKAERGASPEFEAEPDDSTPGVTVSPCGATAVTLLIEPSGKKIPSQEGEVSLTRNPLIGRALRHRGVGRVSGAHGRLAGRLGSNRKSSVGWDDDAPFGRAVS